LSRFSEDGEVTTVDDLESAAARGDNKTAKVRVEFRCSAGQVKYPDFSAGGDEGNQRVHCFAGHFLLALWPGIDVAVQATLVATVAEIDLHGINRAAR